METATHLSAATLAHLEKHEGSTAMPVGFLPQHIETRTRASTAPPADFVPLPLETRTHVRTAIAGWHLSLQSQTLRAHACAQTYDPRLKPVRSCGILLWPVAGIRAVLGVAQ